jgi:FecR protein
MLRVWVGCVVALLGATSSAFAEMDSIATVQELVNIAYRQPVSQPRIEVKLADELAQNETVETEPDASLLLVFLDGTNLRLEGGSTLVLDTYVFDPATTNGSAVFNLGAGVFRFVTGNMNHENIAIETTGATIGIRGTSPKIVNSASGGTVVDVIDGAIVVQPKSGGSEVTVQKGQRAIVAAIGGPVEVTPIPAPEEDPKGHQYTAAHKPASPETEPAPEPEPDPEPDPEPEPASNHSGLHDGSNPGIGHGDDGPDNGGTGNPGGGNSHGGKGHGKKK